MSDDVEKCDGFNVESGQPPKKDWDCNSSSGGSVYQEFHGRPEEAMYSTDDEFMDATETIRSPLLSEDPEEQLSAPILRQLRQEKEQTRYILVDMLSDSESVNNIMEQRKQNAETIGEMPSGETGSVCIKNEPHYNQSSEEKPNVATESTDQQSVIGPKPEKNKFSRTLRLPSSMASTTVKLDRPARGDGRPAIGVSKIPLPVSSMTKLQQVTPTPEQNTPESVSCYTAALLVPPMSEGTGPANPSKPVSRSSVRPSSKQSTGPSSKAYTRPSSGLPKEDNIDIDSGMVSSPKECSPDEETCNPPFAPEELIISKDKEPTSPEKPRIKRARSLNKNMQDEKEVITTAEPSPINSTKDGTETKRMRVANKPPSREEPEKRFTKPAELTLKDPDKRKKEIEAVRNRLAKDRLNLINSRERDEVSGDRQSQMTVDSNVEQKTQDPMKSENSLKSASRKSENGSSQTANSVRSSPSKAGSEKNTVMPEKVSSSPRHLSPVVMNMSIVEKRRQWRQSREAANDDQKFSGKNANMPEIKPPLFKSNQLKTNPLGQRHQDNVLNAPMKSALEDESVKRKNTLVEKRKMMMKQKEAANSANKPATGDAMPQRTGKGLERESREKPSLASQKSSNSDIRKQSAGIPKSSEKTASQHSNFPIQDVQEELAGTDLHAKPSTNTKVTEASMQSVYEMQYKRCEEQLNEVKRAKDKLGINLEKLETLRNQMIQKFGEDVEEYVLPLYLVQSVENSPTVMTTAKGMNTEALEDESESLENNQQLKRDIENLRMQLEEAKEIGYTNKKEDDAVLDLKQRIREMSLTLALSEKRQQTLEDKMKEKQREITSLSNENKQLNDLFKQKDQQLSALRKQVEEKNKELDCINKKLAETNKSLQEELCKNELNHIDHQKLIEEKLGVEKELQEMDARFADFEEREECLNTILENEKKKNKRLEELLRKKEDELNLMEKKFFEMESSSSCNMLIVNDQLQEKDVVINELEIVKTSLQSQIRELCCLLSDLFAVRGIEYNTERIQSLLSTGSLPQLREEVLRLMEERIEESNKAENEARSKIVELQNQVKILQIELEDSKMVSERLRNAITHQKPWDADRPWDEHQRPWSSDMVSARHGVHNNVIENSVRDNKSFRDGDVSSLMPSITSSFVCSDAAMARNDFHELFGLLERKRRQLLQLERKYQDMEEVHSHCAQKRTRNETRIAQLEMMLATYQG